MRVAIHLNNINPNCDELRAKRNGRMTNTLNTVRRKHVAMTGRCWLPRAELTEKIESKGGIVSTGADVTRSTDILVRGYSPHWEHTDHGLKEAAVADLIREGRDVIVVEDYDFRQWLESGVPAPAADYVAGQPIAWLAPSPSEAEFKRVARIRGPLDREQTVKGRTEQRFLRTQLFRGKKKVKCALCGCALPTDLLVAAHIKPRSVCTDAERRDAAHVVFGVCLLGCDALYERGYISVDEKGRVVSASGSALPSGLRMHLTAVRKRTCPSWRDETAKYFEWHYQRRFRG
jgi:hypothetical protein